jgi:UDP-glucose 4-epimerase
MQIANDYHKAQGSLCPEAILCEHSYQDIPAMQRLLEQYSDVLSPQPRSHILGVIHFAALKAVGESIKQPLKYYRNNLNGLVDFLDLLDQHQIKTFIFSSSATVYGTVADRGLPVREEDCVHQPEIYNDNAGTSQLAEQGCTGLTNPYGRTKFFGEAILADVAASDPAWTIIALRYFNPIGCDQSGLIGEDPKGIPSNLLPVVVKVMTKQYPELQVFGSDWPTADGTAIRDYIHVTDLAQGHIAAFSAARRNRLRENFRTFNLGSGTGYSVEEVASTMEAVSHISIPRRRVDRRAGDVGTCVAVADRAYEELEWRTQKTLTDACEDICRFVKLNT